ncbi:MAG: DNA-binding protein [Acidobacteriia bacterium]|nr:DNA-binding protein [Terriglobia bacterium]
MPKTRKHFQRLSQLRANEATVLAKGGKEQGAYYLAGFAIECALKACIAKKTRKHDFPDNKYAAKVYTHDLSELLKLAELDKPLDRDVKTNLRLAAYWGVVKVWNVDSRYETARLNGKDMVAAVTSPTDGVLQWIKQYW